MPNQYLLEHNGKTLHLHATLHEQEEKRPDIQLLDCNVEKLRALESVI